MTKKYNNIWHALSAHADGEKHAMFFELRLSTGWSGSEQRLDAWSIPLWPSLGSSLIAYEVKVSRGDFMKEIKNPEKRQAGLKRSNEFYFVTTPKVVKIIDEIPEECGWMLFEDGELKVMKPAPHRECQPPDWGTIRAICRRAFDSEIIALQRKVERIIEPAMSRAENPTYRVVDRVADWLMEESKTGTAEMTRKLRQLLEPTDMWQWVKHPDEERGV